VELLLSRNCKFGTQAKYGWTALISAAVHGHYDVARILLLRGANVDLTTIDEEKNSFQWANAEGHIGPARG
jgi:ankyrin repeat protein